MENSEVNAVKINEVEALVGITKKNIRFYEEQGLLTPRRNSENGYRDYGENEIDVLRRIKLLRKLGVPIVEIRQLQQGTQTVGDCMRRHLISLEREQQNLEQSIRLCTLLREQEEPLSALDADTILAEMETLEQGGAMFQNKQHQDIRTRYIAPVIAAVLMVLLMAAAIGFLVWVDVTEPENAPPVFAMLILIALPAIVICGIILALLQRIQEIGRRELDDAKKY